MDYLVCNRKRGFTLIEMIVVLSITVLLIMTSDSIYTKLKSYNNLKIATNSLVEAIRYAETNSQTMKEDSTWGVKILPSQMIIFKGLIYASRDTTKDLSLDFPPGITPSGLDELVFSKMTGSTTNTGDIFISNDSGEQKLTINSHGVVDSINNASVSGLGCTGTIWGDVANGYSNNAYLASSVNYPSACVSESRTCTNGVFSGTYTNTSCTVANTPISKWSFEEGSGCVANDSYGSNNGSLQNNCPTVSPSWVIGKTGNALNFNGSSNNVLVNDSTNLNFTTSMSVSAWIKWNINPSSGLIYATIVNKNGDNEYRLQHNGTNTKFEFGIKTDTGGTFVTSTTTPIVGVWYHLVGTWDGNLVKIYVNGNLEQTGTRGGTLLSSTSPIKIGSNSLDTRWFNGIIDEVSVWNRALSQQEVTQLFSSNL